jgi:phospholipid transport system transporter-binding protein
MLLLPSTLTLREARDTQRMLAQGLQAEPEGAVVINASGLQQFDTSALAVLLECHRLAQAFGRGFELRDPPAKLTALAKLYGVDGLLLGTAPAAA